MKAGSQYLQVQRIPDDDLVRAHTPLVRRIAYHLMARLPSSVDVQDLIQSGMIGLLEAARNYIPSREASFETFAGIRIRGAMLDELRRTDWTPRSVHRKSREMAEVIRQIENETGNTAEDTEIMRRMGISSEEYNQILLDANSSKILSLSGPDVGETALEVPDSDTSTPVAEIEETDLRHSLAEAIAHLSKREQLVMSLYYDEELNLKEIGAVLGVSESRVCQIHGQAVIKLRAQMDDWRNTP